MPRYPRSGYRTPGARAMAEASYQKAKARGETVPLSELADRLNRAPRPRDLREAGSSRGELVPASSQAIQGQSRLVREIPLPPRTARPGDGRYNRSGPIRASITPAGFFRAVNVLGLSPQDFLYEAAWNALNNLPGFARPLENVGRIVSPSLGRLPLYKLWGGQPWHSTWNETVLQDSRQTGQVLSTNQYVNVPAGQYVSFYNAYRIQPSNQLRGDEQATYGPAPVALSKVGFVNYPLAMSIPFPAPVPVALLPYLEANTWPQGRHVGPPAPPVAAKPREPWPFRAPPPPRTKERKLGASARLLALLKILGDVTEFEDLLEAFFDALPDDLKGYVPWRRPAKVAYMARKVYQHWDKVDLDSALFNAAWENMVADRVAGMSSLSGHGRYGGSMGANRALSESFGKSQADLLDSAKQSTAQELGRILGLDIKV